MKFKLLVNFIFYTFFLLSFSFCAQQTYAISICVIFIINNINKIPRIDNNSFVKTYNDHLILRMSFLVHYSPFLSDYLVIYFRSLFRFPVRALATPHAAHIWFLKLTDCKMYFLPISIDWKKSGVVFSM